MLPPRSHSGPGRFTNSTDMSSQPLPGPAVVIDVRRTTSYDPPLAWYLMSELEDLTSQMRLRSVKRWRFLSDCIEFVTLDPLPLDRTINTATRFTLIRGNGELQSFLTQDELIDYLRKEYIDLARTNRISAARDTDQSFTSSRSTEVEIERSTVRVFFLADIADPASLTSAASYAALLRKKCEEDLNPLRSGRDERISPIIICMNSDHLHVHQAELPQQRYAHILTQPVATMSNEEAEGEEYTTSTYGTQYDTLLTPPVSTTFDMIILLYAYRDDEGFVGNDAQIYELDLILYTLLLAPETIETVTQEMSDEYAERYLTHGNIYERSPSHPYSEICMLGIASLEYSTSWARRWLDYGLARKVLQTLRETASLEEEQHLLLPDGRDWLEAWWTDLKAALPHTLTSAIPDTHGLADFQRAAASTPFRALPLRHSLQALETFCQGIESHYTGKNNSTLQQSFYHVKLAMPFLKDTLQQKLQAHKKYAYEEENPLQALYDLQKRADNFSSSLFKGAQGALPRAISQLATLENKINEGDIGHVARHSPNFTRLQEQFVDQSQEAQKQMLDTITTYQLPIIGRVLRSTAHSFLLIFSIIVVLWLLQNNLTFLPAALTLSLPSQTGFSLFRLLTLIVLGAGEFFYLSRRATQLQKQRDSIVQPLRQMALTHLAEVQTSIAAAFALHMLQEAELHHSEGQTSRYKQRLRTLDKVLKDAQEQAQLHHQGAYDRLKLGLSPTQTGMLSTSTWLNLQTRKELLHWEQTVQTFQRLSEELLQHNTYFDQLAASLLRQISVETFRDAHVAPMTPYKEPLTIQEQLQTMSSELVATLLVAEATGSSIVMLHPLLERYLSLEQSNQYTPSLLGATIAELYKAVKTIKLEQTMNSGRDDIFQQEAFESLMTKTKKPIEQTLVAWIEQLRENDTYSRILLDSSPMLSRLQDLQIRTSEAIEDLRRRCKLLGYRDELKDGKDSYRLLASSKDSPELQIALKALQSDQIQVSAFPDEEKLIYLHTYRVRGR